MLPQKFSAAATVITRPARPTRELAVLHAALASAIDSRQPARTSHAGRTDDAGTPPPDAGTPPVAVTPPPHAGTPPPHAGTPRVGALGRIPVTLVIPFGYM